MVERIWIFGTEEGVRVVGRESQETRRRQRDNGRNFIGEL
jgi:hypothetical protein